MDNWNDVWQKNTEKGDDPCLINGFEHCENNINSYELFKHIIQVNNIDYFNDKLDKQLTENFKSLDDLNLNYKPELLKSGDLLLFDCFIPPYVI